MKALLAIMLSSIVTLASAQSTPGYVVDSSGKIVKTGSDLCLRTGSYTPSDAVKGCDPVVEKKLTPVSLDSDVLFVFDSSVLTAAGKQALDALVPSVGGEVIVVGHTDRIGTVEYNNKLSVARASTVAKYLSSMTTAKANYTVTGVGSSRPSGKTTQCRGFLSIQLIQCLAPDRRVVVTIIK
jgi:OOP family OmpA-OmpF porin